MKLLERLVEVTINRSPILEKTVTLMEAMHNEVKSLTIAVGALARQVAAHQTAILEIYVRQQVIMKALKSNSLDMKMPDPSDKEKATKPN